MVKTSKVMILLFLLLALSGCATVSENSTKAGEEKSSEAKEQETAKKEEEKITIESRVVVIGATTEGIQAAMTAVKQGAESVAILYTGEETQDKELLSQAEKIEEITLYEDTKAKSLIMDSEGVIRTVRAVKEDKVYVFQSSTVIVSANPLEDTYSVLLSFLSKCEHGNLLVDEYARGLRNTNSSAPAPTKCGVPLAVANRGNEDEPVLTAVGGLYGVGVALCENFVPPSIEEIVSHGLEVE